MRRTVVVWIGGFLSVAVAPEVARGDDTYDHMAETSSVDIIDVVADALADWPAAAKDAALAITSMYGPPDDLSPIAIAWYGTGPFKRTVVRRTGAGAVEQAIAYRVPDAKLGELAAFDTALVVDRRRGELVVRSASQAMNTVVLNLANDIVRGRKTAAQARVAVVQHARHLAMGRLRAASQFLLF